MSEERDKFKVYRPFADRWLKGQVGEVSDQDIDSLAYLLAGCWADGDNRAVELEQRIAELESQLGEAVRYSVEEIRRRTATMAERDEYKESLAKAHRLWTKDTHRITALEGALREISDSPPLGIALPSFTAGQDWWFRLVKGMTTIADAALAGEHVGTKLHSTSMQDGQMVNGEQTTPPDLSALRHVKGAYRPGGYTGQEVSGEGE